MHRRPRPRSTARRCWTARSATRRSRSARTSARRSRRTLSTGMRTNQIGQTADYFGGSAYSSALSIGQQGTGVTRHCTQERHDRRRHGPGRVHRRVRRGTALARRPIAPMRKSRRSTREHRRPHGDGRHARWRVQLTTTVDRRLCVTINGVAVLAATTAALDGAQSRPRSMRTRLRRACRPRSRAGVMTLTAIDGRNTLSPRPQRRPRASRLRR